MSNMLNTTLGTQYRLLAFLLLMAVAFRAPAQIVVDDCNTGAFSISGANAINDLSASGAIGGTRDVQISNTASPVAIMNLNPVNGYLQVRPNSNQAPQGNYDIGWGDNAILGGNELNLDASNHSDIVVSFPRAPYVYCQMTVRFNKPGDPDYASASVALQGPGNYTLPFSNFPGMNPADIDGISIGFSNCASDTVIWIGSVVIDGVGDSDGDGITNGLDNCPDIANADQADADGDGIGDVCDACPNDADNDADGDGICGDVDNCPAVANANQADADNDGIGDVCDACPNDADNDSDGDGICGNVDNCPDVANADQADADGDGIGDVCDTCPNDANNDADGDGICGNVDNCPNVANADQADTDGDGIGDACNGLNIVTFVESMNNYIAGLGLPGGLRNSLQNKLNQVRTRYCAGNITDAISKLNAFMNQVSGLRGNQIPTADADYLLAQAQLLMDAIVAGTAVCPSENRSLVMQDQNALKIGLSPNPAADMVRLDLSAFEGSACTIRMVDVYGKLAREITIDAAVREPLQVDLRGMATGIYLIQVQAVIPGENGESKQTQVSRLMVQQD